MRSPWAREYVRTPHQYIWGTEPSELAREVVRLLPRRARVLELGSGEGRDSVFLAACGFDVTGVELSRAGIDKAERLACAHEVRVRWVHGDMARAHLRGPFHVVYSCGAIHYVPRQARCGSTGGSSRSHSQAGITPTSCSRPSPSTSRRASGSTTSARASSGARITTGASSTTSAA
ncbi:MAG: class I SAM-dependent methyltransferase [Candidatus Rokubacteria bacterium]|nr:class I SAM-dependent methyltransferase [Candidatus Rokubacteria bacterium]